MKVVALVTVSAHDMYKNTIITTAAPELDVVQLTD